MTRFTPWLAVRYLLGSAAVCTLLTTAPLNVLAQAPVTPKTERIATLARLLPQSPRGVGRPITDRAAWQQLAKASNAESAIRARGTADQGSHARADR